MIESYREVSRVPYLGYSSLHKLLTEYSQCFALYQHVMYIDMCIPSCGFASHRLLL